MNKNIAQKHTFNPSKSIKRGNLSGGKSSPSRLISQENIYTWNSPMEKVDIIRKGIPYRSIEAVGQRMDAPVKQILTLLGVPQTTYNKKKKENSLLNGRDSEIIILLNELIDFGNNVFNNEEKKFQRWIKKPNLSLGNNTPESLLDSTTGIQEVMNCLNRIEFGNLA